MRSADWTFLEAPQSVEEMERYQSPLFFFLSSFPPFSPHDFPVLLNVTITNESYFETILCGTFGEHRYCREVDGPKLANMIEFGVTPVLPPEVLQVISHSYQTIKRI